MLREVLKALSLTKGWYLEQMSSETEQKVPKELSTLNCEKPTKTWTKDLNKTSNQKGYLEGKRADE